MHIIRWLKIRYGLSLAIDVDPSDNSISGMIVLHYCRMSYVDNWLNIKKNSKNNILATLKFTETEPGNTILSKFSVQTNTTPAYKLLGGVNKSLSYNVYIKFIFFGMQMSPDDFIRNNRGIDDGKDLPEEYMRSLYARIIKHEIKMKGDDFTPQQKQSTSNKILGLDNILNIVVRRRDSPAETSDEFIKQMQEQFKEKARRSE
jgi:Sec7 domain